ncbi:MAG: response regulator [Planctomycetes bacterium]|nr:response regulator [Planctomycetota bacterium]
MNRHHILVIDDDAAVAGLLEHLLETAGHQVTLARDGREGLALVGTNKFDLVLTDLDMPHFDGHDVCHRIKQEPATRLIPVLMITGRNAQEAKLRAWELGADDYLTKPFDTVEVLARCRSLLRVKQLMDELDSAEAVVFAFARAVEAKCRYTWGHSERVAAGAVGLAQRLGLPEADQGVLRKGAMLHDIGKINIPDAILNKPGALTAAEYEIVKQHPTQGARIVEPLQSIRDTIPLIRWHHERLDGQGYPDGLFGGAIPLMARILAVADVFDAISSERPYRPALSLPESFAILRTNAAGGGLDPELVKCFCGPSATSMLDPKNAVLV